VAEVRHDLPDTWLFAAEEVDIAWAVERRRREYRTGRACLRRALAELGVGPTPVLRGSRGAPRLPAGTVGSITHCPGFRAAAVARTHEAAGIGIDAEPNDPLPPAARVAVCRPEERELLAQLGRDRPDVSWDRLVFSAKESVYKLWFPLTGCGLGFADIAVTPDPAGTFLARLPAEGTIAGRLPFGTVLGRWLVRDDLICTAVTLPATSRPPLDGD